MFSESSVDESLRVANIVKDLLDRTGLTTQEFDALTITIFIPKLLSRSSHPAYYLYPFKEMKITPYCTEYDFYHELGHYVQHMKEGGLARRVSLSESESFANNFMRRYGKVNTHIFIGIRNESQSK